MRATGWPLLLLLLLAVVALGEASRSFLTTRGGAVLKKGASSSSGLGRAGGKRTTVYKKQGLVARVVGGLKSFFTAYWSSLVNPTYEKELMGASKSVADASLKASADRRKRTGARRTGGICDLAPEPSSCGG